METNQGKIKLSNKTYILWNSNGKPDRELWGCVFTNEKCLPETSGWYRTDNLDSLKLRITSLFEKQIKEAEASD